MADEESNPPSPPSGPDCRKPPQAGPTYQPLKSFLAKGVQPGQTSDIQLSGGSTKPYFYSLGVNSTVPFVSVQGAGGLQKEFSWGETILVPPGQTVKLLNASKHKGDIHIQSGRDEHNLPHRISFPVDLEYYSVGVGLGQRIVGFIDTRRCKRGWFNVNPRRVNDGQATFFIYGYYEQHSSTSVLQPTGTDAAWIATVLNISAGGTVADVPLSRTNFGSGLPVDSPIAGAFPDYLQLYYAAEDPADDLAGFIGDQPSDFLVTLEY